AAGQPRGGPRFKQKTGPLSGWYVDYVVDSWNQLLRRSGFGAKDIIRITSKFADSFKGLGVLRQAQDSEQELRVVVLWKRFEAGDFLVEFSNVKALLGEVKAGKEKFVEDGPHCGKDRKIARD